MKQIEAEKVLRVYIHHSHCDECFERMAEEFLVSYPLAKPLVERMKRNYWEIKLEQFKR